MRILVTLTFALFFIKYSTSGQDLSFMDGSFSYEEKADRLYDQMAYAKATRYYEKSLTKSPDDTALKLKLARCHVALNDAESASAYYESSINSTQATDQDFLNYAETLTTIGELEKAENWYETYWKNNSADSRSVHKQEGLQRMKSFYEDSVAYLVQLADFNSEKADFAPTYFSDQTLFVSNREENGIFRIKDGRTENSFLDIYSWNQGQVSKFASLNHDLHEGPMTFFEEGKKVIITTNYKNSLSNKNRSKAVKLRLVIYELTNEGWKYETDFPYNDPTYSVGHPSFDESSQRLYFSSNQPGGSGGVDIYRSSYTNGKWLAPENIESINTEGDEVFPYIDGKNELYFASTGWGGLGGLDLYKKNLSKETGEVYNLGYPVNSPKDDFSLVLDETGKKGYISSNRQGGMGDDDIYELTIYKIRVEFRLVDELTGESLDGTVTLSDLKTGDPVPFELVDKRIVFEAMKGRSYTIIVKKEGYLTNEQEFSATGDQRLIIVDMPIVKDSNIDQPVPAKINKEEVLAYVTIANLSGEVQYQVTQNGLEESRVQDQSKPVVIDNIFFPFDSDDIGPGQVELLKLVDLLVGYETLHLEIKAYCDSKGTEAYNDQLAKKRADKVIDFLSEKGVGVSRVKSSHLGERQQYNTCESTKCTEKQHRQNRRVEFVLF